MRSLFSSFVVKVQVSDEYVTHTQTHTHIVYKHTHTHTL